MKLGRPWSMKGVRPEARQAARAAARRSGMPLNEWIDNAIIDSALDAGIDPQRLATPAEASGTICSKVSAQLDGLTRQLEQLNRGPSPAAVPGWNQAGHPIVDAIQSLGTRLDQLIIEGRSATNELERRVSAVDRTLANLTSGGPTTAYAATHAAPPLVPRDPWSAGLDRAIAEISERQRLLDSEPAPQMAAPPAADPVYAPVPPVATAPAAPEPAPAPRDYTPELSGLEAQLRQITAQIETLRPASVEETVGSLRADLHEIANILSEALPRQALEAVEAEVRRLGERIDEQRRCGVDPTAISGIERGLAEVRDALRDLTPAEYLTGLDHTVQGLAEKVEYIGAMHQDPAALQQLESAISSLRGVVSHVASDSALGKLSDDIRLLAAKIETMAPAPAAPDHSSALNALESRIAQLAESLEQRHRGGEIVPAQIDAIVQSLTEKLERVQLSRGDHMALGHLENRIAKLVERLDASDARLGQLESIERGLVDLLVHLEELRGGNGPGALRAPAAESPAVTAAVDALQRDISDLRDNERRTLDKVEDVHNTLGHVVDRLATIESDIRQRPPQPPAPDRPPEPPRPSTSTPLSDAPAIPSGPLPPEAPSGKAANIATRLDATVIGAATGTPAEPLPKPAPAIAPRRPIDPDLPPDHPLEPGAAKSGFGNSAAERIAASEAALGAAKPPVIPDPAGKSNFIAAARRAAQAAAASSERLAGDEPLPTGLPAGSIAQSLSQRVTQKIRAVFVAASVVVIALGAYHVISRQFSHSDETPVPASLPADPSRASSETPATEPVPPAGTLTPPAGNDAAPSSGVLPPEPAAAPAAPRPQSAIDPTDITGSIPTAVPALQPSMPQPPRAGITALPAAPGTLPTEIGGPQLRQAAIKGDAGAAFEIGVRFAEGRGVSQNAEEAVRWLERAAAQNLAVAQFRLGSMYEKGLGVKKNLERARELYLAAADQGSAKAMHNLAVLYAEGIDGRPDYKTAGLWFRKASDRGVADSQYNLAILHARGIGVEQNLVESYKWFALAARQGDRDAEKKRDEVAKRLDQAGLMAARLAVQTFTPQAQPAAALDTRAPKGGWDHPTATVPAKPRSKTTDRLKVRAAQTEAALN